MDKDIEKNIEYIGYGKLYLIFRKLYLIIYRLSRKIKIVVDNLYFEQYKIKFEERDDDIYIVAFPKSGTTLMQTVLYQLTTKGEMNFNHIYDVSPWIRNAALKRQEVKQYPSPRIIKSHDFYKHFDKETKGRFIFVYRNGMDVAVSLYHQNKNYNKSDLKFDKYIKDFLKPKKKRWFNYTKDWLENKNKFPVLYLKYENLLENKKNEILKIIKFCQLSVEEEAIKRAIEYSCFKFMKLHEDKFGEQPEDTKVYNQFIRKGKKGEGKAMFTQVQEKEFVNQYNKKVKAKEYQIFNNQNSVTEV